MTQSQFVRWSSPEVILVATNLLEGHRLILHAIYQAKLSKAKVLLVHVVPPYYLRVDSDDKAPSVPSSHLTGNVDGKLDEMTKEFEREGVECEPIVLRGLPEEQIQLLVKSRSVDRVIVATRNVTGVSRLVEGSIAEELIAGLAVPVCVIGRHTHPGAESGTPFGRILVATSFQPGTALLVRFASTLAEINHSQLALLHVLETTGMSVQERELARFTARQRLFALIPKEARHRDQPVCLVREGDPAAMIAAEAGTMAQDLVILGSPYPSMLSWLLGTSVVHRVVAESQCPVITISPLTAKATEEMHCIVDGGVVLDRFRADVEVLADRR